MKQFLYIFKKEFYISRLHLIQKLNISRRLVEATL
jgi:hypothetical protein